MLAERTEATKTPLAGRFLLALALAIPGSIALVSAWLAPNHYPPWTSFHGEAAAFAALCFFCLARLFRPEPFTAGRAPLVAFIFVLLVWLQWSCGQIAYGGDALVSSLFIVGVAMAWCLGLNSIGMRGKADPITWIAVLVTVGAVVSVFIGLLQWLLIEQMAGIFATDRGPTMRVYGNLGQPNHLATLMLMATVFAAALYVRGTIKGWHLASLAGWFAVGLTFAESRSALLAAFVVGALLLAKRRQVPQLGNWRFVAGWWLLLILLALAWAPLNEALYLQPPRGAAALTQDHTRGLLWRQSIAAIGQSPWVGYGWRQTIVAQKVGAQFVPGWLTTDYAHNIVLDLVLWMGVPLGLLSVAAAGWWLVRAGVRLQGSAQLFLFAAAIPFLIHSLFEFPFAYAYFLFPAGWILGALSRLQRGERHVPGGTQGLARFSAFAAVMLFGAIGTAVAAEYLLAEEDYRVMRFELRRVGRTPEGYEAPDLRLLTQLDELLKLGRLKPRAGMPAADIERLRIGSTEFGWATLELSYSVALGLNGRPAQASRQLRSLRAIYGEETYAQVRNIFLELRKQHPELVAVQVP